MNSHVFEALNVRIPVVGVGEARVDVEDRALHVGVHQSIKLALGTPRCV
jgi:hypothetical protein